MGSLLSQPALVEHQDPVGLLDRRQPVGDDQAGAVGQKSVESQLDPLLGLGVHRRRRLVQDQNTRVEGQRSGKRDELLLTHRETGAALADHSVEALG